MHGGRCRATLTTTAAEVGQAPALWRELLARPAPDNGWRLLPGADPTLAEHAWIARAGAALRAIAAGRAAKIVLARSRRLQADRPLPVRRLLASLVEQQPESTVFAFGSGQATFLGATPECLVRLAAGEVRADAMAGTAWPGSPALDAPKNRHEQALVVNAIVAALAGCCVGPPQPGAPGIYAAGPVAHLRSVVSGRAAPGTTLFDLVRALHPTPAVGGFPTAAALAWLAGHDERRSGWYSGGFGTLTADGDGEILGCAALGADRRRVDRTAGRRRHRRRLRSGAGTGRNRGQVRHPARRPERPRGSLPPHPRLTFCGVSGMAARRHCEGIANDYKSPATRHILAKINKGTQP